MLSCVWLFTTPWTVTSQGPLSMEFSRQEYWSGWPFPSPGDLPNQGIEPWLWGLPHSSCKKAFLSLLAILWNSAFSWVFSFSPLPFTTLLFSAICKASSDNHFAFLHFFFGGKVLITTSCTMLQTSVHNSSGTLSYIMPWIYLSPPLYSHKQNDLGHTWMA